MEAWLLVLSMVVVFIGFGLVACICLVFSLQSDVDEILLEQRYGIVAWEDLDDEAEEEANPTKIQTLA